MPLKARSWLRIIATTTRCALKRWWFMIPVDLLFLLVSFLPNGTFLQFLRLRFCDRQCRMQGLPGQWRYLLSREILIQRAGYSQVIIKLYNGVFYFRREFHTILSTAGCFCTPFMIRCSSSFCAFPFSNMCHNFWSFPGSDYRRHCILLPVVFKIFQSSRLTD